MISFSIIQNTPEENPWETYGDSVDAVLRYAYDGHGSKVYQVNGSVRLQRDLTTMRPMKIYRLVHDGVHTYPSGIAFDHQNAPFELPFAEFIKDVNVSILEAPRVKIIKIEFNSTTRIVNPFGHTIGESTINAKNHLRWLQVTVPLNTTNNHENTVEEFCKCFNQYLVDK